MGKRKVCSPENIKTALLISGTGGAYTIRGKDLQNSIYDKKIGEALIERYYIRGSQRIVPENAYYLDGNEKVSLLRKNQSGYPPLVTRTLEDILEKGGVEYDSIPCDTIWNQQEVDNVEYSVVCLSTTFMWSELMIERAIEWVDEHINYDYLILGGHYSSIKYEFILSKYLDVDYIIIGDGETALPMLIHHLVDGEHVLEDIPNLAYIRNGKLQTTQHKYENISKLPKVSYNGKFERLSYETVRGCAFGCKFCTWDAGIKCFRYKTASQIVKDVKEYVEENGIKRIEINDSTFFFPFNRIEEVIDGFTSIGVHWKAHCRADVPWTDELVRKLDESNCDILQIGFESMSDRILKNMNKGTTASMNRYTNEMLSRTKIDTVVSFIVGFPDETKEEFQVTSDYIVNEFQGHFYVFVFEMEDKSLELYKERKKYGFELLEDKADCLHGGSNWIHNGMTSEEAFMLREQLLKSVRMNNSMAIYKSWQSPYEWPFISSADREENLVVERLLDNLIFLPKDYNNDEIVFRVDGIRKQLAAHNVYFGG